MDIKHIADIIYFNILKKGENNVLTQKKKDIKKIFISDWELKKKYYDPKNKTITVPDNAILSPMSIDWIDYNSIKIIRKNSS